MSEGYLWVEFDPLSPLLPPERRYVLVQVGEREGQRPSVHVGWLRVHSDGPFFVVPGGGGPVTHFCDCLGDDFYAPLWEGRQC